MIVTSGSVTHNYTIPFLRKVGQVDSNLDVIDEVTVYINTSTTFDYTYSTQVNFDYSTKGKTPEETSFKDVTESRTETAFVQYSVSLSTDSISDFKKYSDLTEDEVLGWAFAADPTSKTNNQNKNEAEVLEKKDKLLNPLKYQKDSCTPPWN